MTVDVFADVFADNTVEEKKEERPVSSAEGKITITLKGGAGFDAPWIVIHASDIPDAYEQLTGDNAALLSELMGKVKSAAQHFSGGSGGGSASAKSVPQQAQEPPADAPDCPPGWQFRSGVSKAGKPYKGFFPPRGDESRPIFF